MSSPLRLSDFGIAGPLLACMLALVCSVMLAGCSGPTPAYVELQTSIMSTLTNKDHRPVESVACRPHLQDVSYSDGIADLNCLVRFKDGSSYDTAATIEARSFQVAGYDFTWDSPPSVDITAAALPRPTVFVAPSSTESLFYARNLRPIVKELNAQFASNQLILRLALYPGELEAVVGANGRAQMVTASASRTLTVGAPTTFEGQRTGITISELDPAVPQRLAQLIAARGGVPTSRLDRFVLTSSGSLAGWDIYPVGGSTRFQALLMGDSLKQITASGTRRLN